MNNYHHHNGSQYSSARDENVPPMSGQNRVESARSLPASLLVRAAMRISRARWFSFLRQVFRYQNGQQSDLTTNPFNTRPWLVLEFVVLAVQMVAITTTMMVSQGERPVWPLKVWIAGYNLGNLLSLPLLYWRFLHLHVNPGISDLEQQIANEGFSSYLMNKSRTFLELFFAIWFVMGNVWVFDSRFGSFNEAPRLHMLCISLLAWNAVIYSFPFLLFVLLCCCVPIVNNVLGYNMNMGSVDRGASDDQISSLPCWRFKELESESHLADENLPEECCICLARYLEQEEVRQLPCSHVFHLRCVDQWLKIISCCPLCKHELERV